jgi:flagellar protein FliO/FliZ
MSFDTYWRFLLALLFVVALIAGCAWMARRFGFAARFGATGGKRRLAIVEVLPLDGRRRLVLLRRDDAEHLVLLGLHNDLVIERSQSGDFSGMVGDGRA